LERTIAISLLGIAVAFSTHKVTPTWICCHVGRSVADPMDGMDFVGNHGLQFIFGAANSVAVAIVNLLFLPFWIFS
jgi:hypothetical protein